MLVEVLNGTIEATTKAVAIVIRAVSDERCQRVHPRREVSESLTVQVATSVESVHRVDRFIELVALRQERWIANVSVTRPLSDEQFARLQAGLNALYGRDLKINVNLEPSLVGGVRVKVGDEVVDATAVTRLSELRRKMAV